MSSTLDFHVGDSGTGTLNVLSGGNVTSAFALRVGSDGTAMGTVVVDGTGSALSVGLLGTDIGRVAGATGIVTIRNGATASLGPMTIGTGATPATAGTTTVGKGDLRIESGAKATGTSLTVGKASVAGTTGDGDLVITGAGSQLTLTAQTVLGSVTAGNASGTILISAGGKLSNAQTTIGASSGGTGAVTVTGTGSNWTGSSSVTIGGLSHTGTGTLDVLAGGTASMSSFIGCNGADVTIDGSGSALTITAASSLTSSFTLGRSGTGNTLTVSGGGSLATNYADLTTVAGSSITIEARGTGTTWTAKRIDLGGAGTSTVTIDDGAAVTLSSGSAAAADFNITGAGATTVTVSDGGTLSVAGNILINGTGDSAARLVIDGGSVEQAQMAGSYQVRLGRGGDAELEISNGGTLHTQGFMFLARGEGYSKATISGAGSKWTWDDGAFIIGSGDDYPITGVGDADVYVLAGGELGGVGNVSVAGQHGSTSSLTVSGAGSKLVLAEPPPLGGIANILVGGGGHGTMIVEDGAYVQAQGIGVGSADLQPVFAPGPSIIGSELLPGEGYLRVSGAGTRVDLDVADFQSLDAGADGGTGLIEVLAGAVVTVVGQGHFGSATIYSGADPEFLRGNGTLTVSGAGSKVTYTETLEIGEQGDGTLNVLAGGYVSAENAYIGSYFNAYDDSHGVGIATVSGAGSQWVNTGFLIVGDEGEGTLHVLAGGKVTSADGTEVPSTSRVSAVAAGAGSSGTVTIDGTGSLWEVTGDFALAPAGTGSVTLTDGGALSVTGSLTIGANGTLNFGTGATAGTLSAGGIANGGTLAFNNTGELTLGAAISGNGALTKAGAGTVLLTGTSSFIGLTTINGGQLRVNGTLPGAIAVNAGGILGGSGSTGAVSIASGGRIAPGNSIDTLTVASAYFAAGSVLEVEIDDAGNADLLQVTGAATINAGASVFVVPEAGSYAVGSSYLILDAATRSGAFGSVTDSSAFLSFALDHTVADQVWLRVASITDFSTAAVTPNQVATAGALQGLLTGNPVFDALTLLDTAEAQHAFDQLSGEIYATTLRVLAEDSRWPREAALDRVDSAFAALAAGRDMDQWGRNIWGRTYGGLGEVAGDGNAAPIGSVSGGLVVGVDGLVADNLFLGVLAGVGNTRVEADERASSADITSYSLGVYGGYAVDGLKLKFGGAVSGHTGEVMRRPAFDSFSDEVVGEVGGATAQFFGEVGYAFALGEATVEPFARAAAVRSSGWDYDETGGPAAVAGEADDYALTVLTAGLRGAAQFTLGDGLVVKAKGMLGVQRSIGDLPATTHTFAGSGPFTVVGATGDATVGIISAGLAAELSPGVDFDLTYTGTFGVDTRSGALAATISGRF